MMSHDTPAAKSLEETLADVTAGMAKHAAPEVLATIGSEIKKLAESGIAARALRVGAKAPDFSLPDSSTLRPAKKVPTSTSAGFIDAGYAPLTSMMSPRSTVRPSSSVAPMGSWPT